jgi:hypothetical protein
MRTTATYDSAAGTFTLVRDKWQGTFPIGDLPKWLAFIGNSGGDFWPKLRRATLM